MRIVEHAAAVIVEEAFGPSTLRQDRVMGFEFDVEILDLLRAVGLIDRNIVDQIFCLNQNPVQIHGMVRRDPEIMCWHIIGQGSGLKTDGQNILAAKNEAACVATPAAPLDRAHRT